VVAQISGYLFVNEVKYNQKNKDGAVVGLKNTSALMQLWMSIEEGSLPRHCLLNAFHVLGHPQ
jgi:hypothetical protein